VRVLQEERAISPVGTLEYMPPEILRLPSTDLVVKGLVSVDDITPVDEKVRGCSERELSTLHVLLLGVRCIGAKGLSAWIQFQVHVAPVSRQNRMRQNIY
jgi:hypothetical protein